MKLRLLLFFMAVAGFISINAADRRPAIFVNADVTTHIIMPEQLKMVDISTDMIAGDQCTDNMVRIKPVAPDSLNNSRSYFHDTQFLGTVTMIGERHMTQYDIIYNSDPTRADAIYNVKYEQSQNYSNPNVVMPESEMANYSWAISNTKRRYNSVRANAYGISASVYNIYAIGNYFFIDMYLKNNTNIQYDIAQMRISLTDKNETKATNSQTIELTPAFILNNTQSFKKDYRQVIVLEKLTFPEEKLLNIEISEDQISGRVITISIEYEDILNADCFDDTKMDAYELVASENKSLLKEINRMTKEIRCKTKLLDEANKEINDLGGKLKKTNKQYLKMGKKLAALQKLHREFQELENDITLIEDDNERLLDSTSDDYDLTVISE